MRDAELHNCLRVYPNGDRVWAKRDDANVHVWREYNETMRPGNALFIDGKSVSPGLYMNAEQVAAIEAELAAKPA